MSVMKEKELTLTNPEKVELQYLYLLGFRYIARNEIGSVKVFKKKPSWFKGKTTYGLWSVDLPIKDHSLQQDVKIGKYEFLNWQDEPLLIEDLIDVSNLL